MLLTRLIPLAAGLLMLVAGCDGSANAGGPTTPDATSAAAASSGASTIKDPLDISKLQSDPCSALAAAQLAPYVGAIDRIETQPPSDTFGCGWYPVDGHQPAISVQLVPGQGPDKLDQSGFPWHEPASNIAGYPAEYNSELGDSGPKTGDCTVYAAVSEHATVGIFIQGNAEKTWPYYTDACTPADKLVAQVIVNLKSRA